MVVSIARIGKSWKSTDNPFSALLVMSPLLQLSMWREDEYPIFTSADDPTLTEDLMRSIKA